MDERRITETSGIPAYRPVPMILTCQISGSRGSREWISKVT